MQDYHHAPVIQSKWEVMIGTQRKVLSGFLSVNITSKRKRLIVATDKPVLGKYYCY